jgi:hypothetical protein
LSLSTSRFQALAVFAAKGAANITLDDLISVDPIDIAYNFNANAQVTFDPEGYIVVAHMALGD